jgi:hypothetical protein
MTDSDFQHALLSLRDLPFREDFEAALYDLYRDATSAQQAKLRAGHNADTLGGSKTWRNPADYNRSDLTREQRIRQNLMAMSLRDGAPDYRDDLMSIAYCYHNLALLGLNANATLDEIARISGPTFAVLVRGFLRRSPEDMSLEAFGLRIQQTPDGTVAEFKP